MYISFEKYDIKHYIYFLDKLFTIQIIVDCNIDCKL